MAIVIQRRPLTLKEKLYVPSIISGLATTLKHLVNTLTGRTKVAMQYPEEKWDSHLPRPTIAARPRWSLTNTAANVA